MSLIEKVILIIVGLIPLIALMMFLPKIIKNKKTNKPNLETPANAEPKPTPVASQPEPAKKNKENANEFDDFADYANLKKNKVSAPKRNFPKPNYDDFLERYVPPRQMNSNQNQKEKTIKEEFASLSPQLKALIISGALDRKNFDD